MPEVKKGEESQQASGREARAWLVMGPTIFDRFERDGVVLEQGGAPVAVSEAQARAWIQLRDSDGNPYVVRAAKPTRKG